MLSMITMMMMRMFRILMITIMRIEDDVYAQRVVQKNYFVGKIIPN